MKAIIQVFDKRTFNGYNTRVKEVDTEEQAIKWAKSIKNKVSKDIKIYEKSIIRNIRLD